MCTWRLLNNRSIISYWEGHKIQRKSTLKGFWDTFHTRMPLLRKSIPSHTICTVPRSGPGPAHWFMDQILCVFGPKYRSRVQYFRVQSPGPGSSDSKMPYILIFPYVYSTRIHLCHKPIHVCYYKPYKHPSLYLESSIFQLLTWKHLDLLGKWIRVLAHPSS